MTNAYQQFREVNAEFKAAVSDWQLKSGQPNTHDDADYDAAVVARVEAVHQKVTPIVMAAAAQLPRLRGYSVKLQRALEKVKAGEVHVADPTAHRLLSHGLVRVARRTHRRGRAHPAGRSEKRSRGLASDYQTESSLCR